MAGNLHPGASFHARSLYGFRRHKSVRAWLKPDARPVRDRIFSDNAARRIDPVLCRYSAVIGHRISAPLGRLRPPPIRTVSDFDLPFINLWCPIKKGPRSNPVLIGHQPRQRGKEEQSVTNTRGGGRAINGRLWEAWRLNPRPPPA
jgi:hypothetical protein